jgi:hypothetical protein
MNRFSQFNVQIPDRGFEGDKIKISKVLNREIIVHGSRIEDTKIKKFEEQGSGKCMHLQISLNGTLYILFTGSGYLINAIKQIPRDQFPFTTTIVEENGRFIFT